MESNVQPHPAQLDVASLLAACEIRRQRRSGPGGQHRNKVETGVFIKHLPTGIESGATERRSQDQNQSTATERLRLKLAVNFRRHLPREYSPSNLWRARCDSGRLVVSATHVDFAALLAEALDVLALENYAVHAAAKRLCCTGSQLTKLLRSEHEAFIAVNKARVNLGMGTLK